MKRDLPSITVTKELEQAVRQYADAVAKRGATDSIFSVWKRAERVANLVTVKVAAASRRDDGGA